MININEKGFWENYEAHNYHDFDEPLANAMSEFLIQQNATSVVDLGCGMGTYVKTFLKNNINAKGFDGNPYTNALTNYLCDTLDLSVPIVFPTQFDWVLSLEVGEHLPKEYEDIFINNLHVNNKHGIIVSWAVKGQGGIGHFNEQNNDYIKDKITSLGYISDIDTENKLRNVSTLPWFKNTIMVFKKQS
jgi:cyclopropane fatty-acyl-phospholipid synthase-like methyltransferase